MNRPKILEIIGTDPSKYINYLTKRVGMHYSDFDGALEIPCGISKGKVQKRQKTSQDPKTDLAPLISQEKASAEIRGEFS